VDDHCEAIYTIIEKGKIGETYNVGGNNEIQKSYLDLITFVSDRPGHDFRYAIDSSKLKNELNWSPNETFHSGIRKTIDWYLENQVWWQDIQNNTYQQERLGVV